MNICVKYLSCATQLVALIVGKLVFAFCAQLLSSVTLDCRKRVARSASSPCKSALHQLKQMCTRTQKTNLPSNQHNLLRCAISKYFTQDIHLQTANFFNANRVSLDFSTYINIKSDDVQSKIKKTSNFLVQYSARSIVSLAFMTYYIAVQCTRQLRCYAILAFWAIMTYAIIAFYPIIALSTQQLRCLPNNCVVYPIIAFVRRL